MSICHQEKTLASASQGVGVAQISAGVAGAKLGLLQLESWSSGEVALIGRALQGPKGSVAISDRWFAGLLPESWDAHYRTHRTNRTNRTNRGLPQAHGLR